MDIRLKEVLTNLRNYDFDILGNYKMDKSETYKLIGALEDLESGGWIPCEERLPEDDVEVLACSNFGGMYIAWIFENEWHSGEDNTELNIIAWQSLPKPFKESEDNK